MELADELKIPRQYDLILSNPPWLPAYFVFDANPLDNAIYDPHEHFLQSSLNFARLHLSKSGRMLLVYTDLAELLGLQDAD